jgi:archaellin
MKGQGGSGFSAMVLFIAAALTAAIAALVIIGATTSAQGHAAAAAQQTVQTSGTTVEIVRVEGINVNTTSQSVQEFLVYTRLAPGSQPILLNQTALIFYAPAGREVFTYGGAVANSSLVTGYTGYYYIDQHDSVDNSGLLYNGVLGPNDLAALLVYANVSLGTSQIWEFSVIPPNGQPYDLSGVTPAALVYPTVILYG